MFLDNVPDDRDGVSRNNWVARWTSIGDAQCQLGDLNVEKKRLDEAIEAWLCALTAFEVARRLGEEEDPQNLDVSAKVEAGIQRFGAPLERKLERIQVCCDVVELSAYYLPAGSPELPAPAVICISRDQETAVTLLGRLLPAVIGRRISILVVSHDEVSNHWRGQSEISLSCCLDYLSARPDVDAARIGVYGEGLSAVLATTFAVSDGRVAAAVCDGGLWDWARTRASVGWMTMTDDVLDEGMISALRSRLVRQVRCPVLVVAGGRGTVSISEAIELQADCTAARIDLELAIPHMIRTAVGEIENFVRSDDCILGWLESKLETIRPRNYACPMAQ
ncbi:alpha/beta hydrolase [Bradyrhizobium sp. CCGB12]|uniref:alpha/beta hydrolase family protein n=1 Tax=Bradyrhizobium sp. CCGB12 TaxID=2949632 RepID=UPI0020B2C333|nr:alpha/beta hydrolase [Bradyrhizobium sp. CCGB12]MCP3392255.1 alpha/beta hydrolase [Bradyrhizobium sp. CCGB12]